MLSKSESGKLGAKSSKITAQINKNKRIIQYNLIPNKCKHCKTNLNYKKRKYVFCSHKCSSIFNNIKRGNKNKLIRLCIHCKINSTKRNANLYCSTICMTNHTYETKIKPLILQGKINTRPALKKYLKKEVKDECFKCGLTKWYGVKLPLEVDHIDGNAGNNFPANIRLLCSNCHSITSTWKGKNFGNGRKSRGLSP